VVESAPPDRGGIASGVINAAGCCACSPARPRRYPETLAERAALWRAQLTRRRAVVVLDDVAEPDQIAPLLPAGGKSLVLITSRYRLPGLADARTLTLDVLPAEDAITLFRQIAGPAAPGDEDEDAAAVESCGRLPLAIQLTAGRLAQRPPPRRGELVAEMPRPPAVSAPRQRAWNGCPPSSCPTRSWSRAIRNCSACLG
jgi:NB-ARC domain